MTQTKTVILETVKVTIIMETEEDSATLSILSTAIGGAIDQVRKATAKTPPPPSGCRGCGDGV